MADGTTGTLLSRGESLALATALAVRRAEELGIRVLVIKGAVASHYGLRSARNGADVDVLVEPGRSNELVAALGRAGWSRRAELAVSTQATAHSVTMVHEGWPCELDIHYRFPGFLKGDVIAFETLYESRSQLSVAGVIATIPSINGAIAIAVLHGIRPGAQGETRPDEVSGALAAVRAMDAAPREAFWDFCHASGCAAAMPDFLAASGAEHFDDPGVEADAWRLRLASGGTASSMVLGALGTSGWRARVGLLASAVWPSSQELSAVYGLPEDAPRLLLWRVRLGRVGRGARDICRALRSARTIRARQGHERGVLRAGERGEAS